MTENKNWRARSIKRSIERRRQQKHTTQRLDDLAEELVRYGPTVQEGVYAKMTPQSDVKVLRSLVEQKIADEQERIAVWSKQQNASQQATCA